MEALRVLPKYDPGGFDEAGEPRRKLENFLFVAIRNSLLNLVRRVQRRSDPPCTLCHRGQQATHPDGQVCQKYRDWKSRNDRKANLARPVELEAVADETETAMHADSTVEADARLHEATELLDELLPAELRGDYLRMRSGHRLTKARRQKVEGACREILKGFLDDDDADT